MIDLIVGIITFFVVVGTYALSRHQRWGRRFGDFFSERVIRRGFIEFFSFAVFITVCLFAVLCVVVLIAQAIPSVLPFAGFGIVAIWLINVVRFIRN